MPWYAMTGEMIKKSWTKFKLEYFLFPFSIQEEVRAVESETASYFEHFSRYYLSRAKIVCKIAKYPHVVSTHTHTYTWSLWSYAN